MDDDELIAALTAGDDTALRELFMRHAPLEGRDVIEHAADDLRDVFTSSRRPPVERYPPG